MDDLDLLARVRSDVPELDRFTEARVRIRLVATTDAAPGDADADPPLTRLVPAGGGRRAGPRWVAARVGVAAAAVAAVLAGGFALTGRSGTSIGATPAAAGALEDAANAASRAEPLPVPGPDQVLYRRTWGSGLSLGEGTRVPGAPVDHVCQSVHEIWMPADPDATRQVTRRDGVVVRPGDADPATYPRDRLCFQDSFTEDVGTAGGSDLESPAYYAALPTDPEQLYERARRESVGQGSSPAEGTLFTLVSLASSSGPYLSPRQVAAIYRAMKYVPGIELLGRTQDMLGRTGVAVGREEPGRGYRQEAIFDPDTGRMLGEREILVAPGMDVGGEHVAAGTVLSESVITTAIVDAVGERPRR